MQQALLKILEGKQASITPDGARNRPQQELIQVDTTDILFVCTGAFNGLEEIVRRRVGTRGLGFGASMAKGEEDKNALRSLSRTEDLIKYGMIPEFMGRLPIIVSADELDVDDLVRDPVEAEERAGQAVREAAGDGGRQAALHRRCA